MKVVTRLINLPFKVLFAILGFIVWDVLSDGRWKQRKRAGGCPAGYWQGQAQWEAYKNRQLLDERRKLEADLRSRYERQLKKKEREISHLRSRLANTR